MGISIESYRSRIGTFRPSQIKYKSHTSTEVKLSKPKIFSSLAFLVLLSVVTSLQLSSRYSPDYNPSHLYKIKNSPAEKVSKLQESPHRLSGRDWNFYAKITNGNRGSRGSGIKLMHWNKGPSFLQNKHNDIEAMIADHHPHVFGLSEANLRTDHDLNLVQHTDYNLHLAPTALNPNLQVSRVVAYTHKSLVVKRRADLEDSGISAIWLEVGLPHKKKIVVCQAYREWRYLDQQDSQSHSVAAQFQRWSIFLNMWEKALLEGKEVVVMMDANLDFLKWAKEDLPPNDSTTRLKSLVELLFCKIIPHGVSQVVTVPTRSWPGQPEAGLDHIYTNKPDKLSEVYTEYSGGSDHKLLKITRYAQSMRRNVRYVRKRCFKEFNNEDFQVAVKNISWWELYSCQDPEVAAAMLTEKLSAILDTMAPLKTIQVRSKYAPWLSQDTKNLMKERNAAQDTATKTRDLDDWRLYKSLRNMTTMRMRQERKDWERRKLDSTRHSPTSLWKNVKSWLSWNNSGPPSQLFHQGRLINSPAGLAGAMNSFFIDKVKNLRKGIPTSDNDPLQVLRETLKNRQCSFKFRAVTPNEVLKIVKGLKNSKSTGIDDIDTAVIKLVAEDILAPLTHIINLSIEKAVFPAMWKQAKVIPLLKKGDPLAPKNYRPVALLPIFSKILERVIYNQLVEYLDSEGVIHPNHHGSRQGHSTATALIQMYDKWVEEADQGNMVGVVMVDLSAAFDMVDHNILLEKLKIFGLENSALLWMTSYLAGRSQRVYIDGCLSPPLNIEYGVPQGSILGPLMYILFTNDVPSLIHSYPTHSEAPELSCNDCGDLVCYVDDGTFSVGHKDPVILSGMLSSKYKAISNYMVTNKLVINDDKTNLMVMGTKANRVGRGQVELQAGNHRILPAKTGKLLGCEISDDLKWRYHLRDSEQSLIRQLTSRVNGLTMLSSRADFDTRLMVANGLVISKLCYLIQLWGGSESYLLHSLQVLQNKAGRAVTGWSGFTSTRRLMGACNWLSVKQLVVYQTVIMIFKTLRTESPWYLHSKLSPAPHPFRARQSTMGNIRLDESHRCKSSLKSSSLRCRGAVDYNRIPVEIRASPTLATFKKKLRQWVKDNIDLD